MTKCSSKMSLNRNKYKTKIIMLSLFLLIAYLADNLVLGPIVGGLLGNHILPVLLWGFLAIYALYLPPVQYSGKRRFNRLMKWLVFVCLLVTMLITFGQGLIFGFGRSPYDRSLIGIAINAITFGAPIVVASIARSWLANKFFSKPAVVGVFLIALLFTAIDIPLISITTIDNIRGGVEFFATDFVSTLAENILATYFALLGGALPAFMYQFGIMLFERITPVLPNSPWVLNALFSTLSPIIGLILIREVYQYETRQIKITRESEGMFGWLGMGFVIVLMIWFALGVFSVYPRVILTGSMVPEINIGDVVLISRVEGDEAGLGDVVAFQMGEVEVVHRVIEVKDINGQRHFVTKGDASDSPDDGTLIADNIKGKVVNVVPKLGWITLILRGQ